MFAQNEELPANLRIDETNQFDIVVHGVSLRQSGIAEAVKQVMLLGSPDE